MSDGVDPRDERTASDPLIGEVIDGRFRIESLLGAGSMGRVYRATQVSVGRDVAVKVLQGEYRSQVDYRKRFFREAKVISGFTHPNIVRLIDFGEPETGNAYYIVMELIEGVELSALTERGRLDPEFATEVVYQTAAALIEAHDAEILHRDLKTDNLLLVPLSNGSMQVKVLDFGVAFPLESGGSRLTQAGLVLGTPPYMSPEQAEGEPGTPVSDIYALGVIYFFMLTGSFPVIGESKLTTLRRHLEKGRPAPSQEVEADIPGVVDQLVLDMIARDPERRPGGGRVVRRRIDAIREQLGWDRIGIRAERSLEEIFLPFVHSDAEGGRGDVETDPASSLVTVVEQPREDRDAPGSSESADEVPRTGETTAPATPEPQRRVTADAAESAGGLEAKGAAASSEQEIEVPAAEQGARAERTGADPHRDSDQAEAERPPAASSSAGRIAANVHEETEQQKGTFERRILWVASLLFIAVAALGGAIIYFDTGAGERGESSDSAEPMAAGETEGGGRESEGRSAVSVGESDEGNGEPSEGERESEASASGVISDAGDGSSRVEADVDAGADQEDGESEAPDATPDEGSRGGRHAGTSPEGRETASGSRPTADEESARPGDESESSETTSAGAAETVPSEASSEEGTDREKEPEREQASSAAAAAGAEEDGSPSAKGSESESPDAGASSSSSGAKAAGKGAGERDAGSAGGAGADAGPSIEESMEWLEGK